jgi:hypothetical protein
MIWSPIPTRLGSCVPGRPQRGTGERPDPVVPCPRRLDGGRMGHDRVGHRASTLKTTSTRFNHEAWMGSWIAMTIWHQQQGWAQDELSDAPSSILACIPLEKNAT